MRIGTFNIWNDDKNYMKRMELLIEVIKEEKLDILVLQEVRDELIVNRLATECEYEFVLWKKYFDCQEGLAILSKYGISNAWTNWDHTEDVHNSFLMHVKCKLDGKSIDIMNVHLDYEKASHREIEILKAVNYLKDCDGEYKLMLGDFNTTQNSSVYRFLTGRQSLKNEDANWIDIPESYSFRRGLTLEPTIDFIANPRWLGKDSLELPARFDWILIEEPYPQENPVVLKYKLLGNKIVDGITPSDHYGLMIEMKLPSS